MDLGEIATDLQTWMAITCLDIDGGGTPLPVEFGRIPNKVHTSAFVRVYLGPIIKHGYDFPRYVLNQATGAYVEQMRGVRTLPIRFQFRTFNQSWGKNARQYAEDFRNALQSTESLEGLAQTKLTFQSSGDLIASDYEMSGKLISQVDLTVYFGAAGYQRQPSYDAGFIRTVYFEGQNYLLDVDGNPIKDSAGNPIVDLDIREFTVDSRTPP